MVLIWVVIEVILLVIGAALGNLLQDPMSNLANIYWSIVCLALGTINIWLFNDRKNSTDVIDDLNNKVSSLIIRKNISNQFDVAINETAIKDELIINSPTNFSVYISTPIRVNDLPDLLIKTDKKIIVNTGTDSVSYSYYAKEFNYVLENDKATNTYSSSICCCFHFDVIPIELGVHKISFQVKNEELIAETNYSFSVKSIVQR